MTSREELRKKYWTVLCRTRKFGRISQGVKDKEEAYWSQFPAEVVDEALRIHISRYTSYKECYTRGIIRNLAKEREQGRGRQEKNDFCRFPQRDYDFDALEKQLVNNMKEVEHEKSKT